MYLIAALLATGILGIQVYLAQSNTEQQDYRLVESIGDMEIRFYPSSVLATVNKQGAYKAMMNAGFRDLAGYIFGGNQEAEKIAMTAPVISVHDDTQQEAEISFVMPAVYTLESLPSPKVSHIRFSETGPGYTASLTFGGFADEGEMAQKSNILLSKVAAAGLETEGPVSYLYYNPPYQAIGRRNEVLVRLKEYQD